MNKIVNAAPAQGSDPPITPIHMTVNTTATPTHQCF